jgi:hypothetical protein
MKNKFLNLVCVIGILILMLACKKEFDVPPVKTLETTSKINIAQIKAKYTNINYRFKSDSSLYCVVTADEVSGNLYKDVYVRDVTGAIHVKLIASGGLFVGDSIRINLQNCILNSYSNLIQLDSVDTEKSIVKLASGLNPQPVTMTIQQIIANTAATNSVQSRLVRINNVEFLSSDMNTPFADAIGKTSINKIIQSCDGTGTLTVRTSGYASFANQNTPTGNGTFIGIVGQFGTTMQMTIRNLSEVNMTGALCSGSTPTLSPGTFMLKNFDDGLINSTGWTNVNVVGTINWATATSSTNPTKFAQCNNFVGTGNQRSCETWLISNPVDLTNAASPTFSFSSAFVFNGPALSVYISTNYTSGLPSTATWTQLSASFGTNSTFKPSGNINLSAYKTNNVRVAFKYLGGEATGSRWQVDDVRIGEP